MLEWSTTPLHTSLCHLHRGVPRSAPARCHVLILQLMGDAPVPHGGGGSPAILLAKLLRIANDDQVSSVLLCTVTFYANRAHNLTRSP